MASRTILLVRHGQEAPPPYPGPLGSGLSPLGQVQARRTAKYLSPLQVKAIFTSTMPRATETARIIAAEHPEARLVVTRQLCEGIGIIPPRVASYLAHLDPSSVARDRARLDRLYARFFRPARRPTMEIIVAHGNLISYLIARALEAPPESWVRMEISNCGISRLVVGPEPAPERGIVLQTFNETGHLSPSMVTVS